jgi:trypsin-like peptidase
MTARASRLLARRLLALALGTWSLWTSLVVAEHSAQGAQSGAPTPVQARWYEATDQLLSLAVMLDGGANEACAGAGFIVGYKQASPFTAGTLFVLTADHVVEGISRRAGLSELGVRFRIVHDRAYRRKEPLERRLPAHLTHRDRSLDLAVLEVRDADVAEAVRSRLDYEMLGDSANLVVNDPLYAVGCGNGIDWDMPIEPAGVVAAVDGEETIAFDRAYVREGFSGGPVAHIFESQSTLVGMTVRVDNSRVLARPIHVLLRQAQTWGVPVLLVAPGTELGCQYRVHPLILHLSATGREAFVNVDTTESCRWSVREQVDAALAERLKWWLDVSAVKPPATRAPTQETGRALTLSDLKAEALDKRGRRGPGTVRVAAGPGSPCDNRPVHAVVRVAGQLVRVFYTGQC